MFNIEDTESKNDGKKAGGTVAPGGAGKKGGKGDTTASSKAQDKKGEKKVLYCIAKFYLF